VKVIINASESFCYHCMVGSAAKLDAGQVVCFNCGTRNLLDPFGGLFYPRFGFLEVRMYQASPYTPLFPDRRKRNIPWPAYRERRRATFYKPSPEFP